MCVSWKARKSTFLFHSGILERGTNHNSIQEKVQNSSIFEKNMQISVFIIFFAQKTFFLHHILCTGFQPKLRTRFLEFTVGLHKSQNREFHFLSKTGFGHFDSFTIMGPTSLQDAGMKKKSRFSGFPAHVHIF